jgi:hypothetical protein
MKRGRGRCLWINRAGQLDAAAAGAELLEPELEPFDEVELDLSDDDFSDEFSDDELGDDEDVVDSELLAEPLDELFAVVLAASRLSLR